MASSATIPCANCGHPLDATDKFCRECGLPSAGPARPRPVPGPPPDTDELKRALNVMPEPRPFVRSEADDDLPDPESTSDVVHGTSPAHSVQMATSTLVMIGLIVVLTIGGVVFLVLAVR